MEAYKERFVEEYKQLVDRHRKLRDLLDRYDLGKLDFTPDCPIELLACQENIMDAYKDVLEERAKIEHIDLSI